MLCHVKQLGGLLIWHVPQHPQETCQKVLAAEEHDRFGKNDEKGMLSDDFALLQSCKRVFFLLVIDPTSHQTMNFLLAVTRMSHEDTVSQMHNF